MVTTPAITNTPRTVTPQAPFIENEKAFSLAKDTLKKLFLCHHAINEQGAPIVSGDLNFDRRIERKNDVGQYFAHLYATNKFLKDKLNGDTVKNVNDILKTSFFLSILRSKFKSPDTIGAPCSLIAWWHKKSFFRVSFASENAFSFSIKWACGVTVRGVLVIAGVVTICSPYLR